MSGYAECEFCTLSLGQFTSEFIILLRAQQRYSGREPIT